ncbi:MULTISPECIES: aminoacyl-tRNA hydrolase [Flavobacteriaceae]|jgi:PTH1 family peptidyl-tRNA hydrolase|uniref:Peptidyl-tRNA hydrolase n=1 Tax=Flagellimonas marinaquae TaxID=254955 RepID=A0AA48HQT7_9FLAO|nr:MULTISPECIES: aminoacyl-tRNA hydrolase [Allomuricauda]MCA0958357.1 aminoacyl-tRNA hydrolase [Allomuricauda ruestringensis]USD23778.1 aminoacyl-tRNA hydrolase [Allomuricauda aquimarina]BDW92696.1 peptidyl-tRNA hydrolase [Allomuricauda aquimarina]
MLNFINKLFGPPKKLLQVNDPMKKFLIVGLGNIGPDYDETRHNIGFKILDYLAEQEDFVFENAKLGAVATFKHKGKSVVCLKPSTYMNLSGKAVKYWMDKENIPMENILIVTDDLNLPFGSLRLKSKGSDGGHNGLKDIQNVLQTSGYNRFRFGVGADFSKGKQVDYVLGRWNDEQQKAMPERLKKSIDLIRSFVFAGTKNTMNQFNGK